MHWQEILKDLSDKEINEHMSKVRNMREKNDSDKYNPNKYKGDDGETYFETQIKYRIARVTGGEVGDSLANLGFARTDIITELNNLALRRYSGDDSPVLRTFTNKLKRFDKLLREYDSWHPINEAGMFAEGTAINMWNKEIDDLALLSATVLNNKFPNIESAKKWFRESGAYYDVNWNPNGA